MSKVAFSLLGLMGLFLGTGVWIGLGLIAAAVSLLMLYRPTMPFEKLLAQQTFNTLSSPELLALPLFILMAEVLFRTRIAEALFTGLSPWLRRVPGRLGHLTVMGCTLFASVCGSSAATTAMVGRITAKELLDRGYDRDLVIGSLAGAGTLGFLIPPSTIMIIYGVMAEESIVRLFMAGILPGAMIAAAYMGYIAIRAWLNPDLVGKAPPPTSLREKLAALRDLGPLLILIFVVIGSMYGGIASPTEAAAVGVAGAIGIGFWQRTLNFPGLLAAARSAADSCAMIGLIMLGAMFLSTAIGYLGQHGMGVDHPHRDGAIHRRRQRAVQTGKGVVRRVGLDGDLQLAAVIAIDRDPGAVGAAIGHGDKHVGQQLAQLRAQILFLQEQANDAAHVLLRAKNVVGCCLTGI